MRENSVAELQKEMEKVRGRLYALVNGDVDLLLDSETYKVSSELDRLIVTIMKKQMQIKQELSENP
ncbi:MAG: Spo0E family sporulation regulatory protein-aspartic acid phosphatase [Clostridia bacterium]|nr:Spo0E family sporulation regulatory protein-aspartic acid phosphatase [Clostridia bacterium]